MAVEVCRLVVMGMVFKGRGRVCMVIVSYSDGVYGSENSYLWWAC